MTAQLVGVGPRRRLGGRRCALASGAAASAGSSSSRGLGLSGGRTGSRLGRSVSVQRLVRGRPFARQRGQVGRAGLLGETARSGRATERKDSASGARATAREQTRERTPAAHTSVTHVHPVAATTGTARRAGGAHLGQKFSGLKRRSSRQLPSSLCNRSCKCVIRGGTGERSISERGARWSGDIAWAPSFSSLVLAHPAATMPALIIQSLEGVNLFVNLYVVVRFLFFCFFFPPIF